MEKDNLMELIDNMVDRRKVINNKIDDNKKSIIMKGFDILLECAKYANKIQPYIAKLSSKISSPIFKEVRSNSYGFITLEFRHSFAYKGLYISCSNLNTRFNCIELEEDKWYENYSDFKQYPNGHHEVVRQMAVHLVSIGYTVETFKTEFKEWLVNLIRKKYSNTRR